MRPRFSPQDTDQTADFLPTLRGDGEYGVNLESFLLVGGTEPQEKSPQPLISSMQTDHKI